MSTEIDHMAEYKAIGRSPEELRAWAEAIMRQPELRCGYTKCVLLSPAAELERIKTTASRELAEHATKPSESGVAPSVADLVDNLANLYGNLVDHVEQSIDSEDWGPLDWESWNEKAKALIAK
jgi:hypothetical protein